jgi:hypothetical protein
MTYQDFGSRVIIAEPDDPPDSPPRRRKCSVCGKRRRCVDRYLDGSEWTCVPCLRAEAREDEHRRVRAWEEWISLHSGTKGPPF